MNKVVYTGPKQHKANKPFCDLQQWRHEQLNKLGV